VATAAIITASDGVSRGRREDRSGAALADVLVGAGFEVVGHVVVPDERDDIADAVRRFADEAHVGVVVITGGTGFGPRDVTPEATEAVIDRRAPNLAEAMRAAGRATTPLADLSRGTAGVRGRTLVLNVPGSPRGATESLQAVLPLLPHVLDLLAGRTEHNDTAPAASGHHDQHGHDHGGDPDHAVSHGYDGDEACALAHGVGAVDRDWRLVAISASPVALYLLHWGRELGYRTILVEPDRARVSPDHRRHADEVVADVAAAAPDATTDVVATDHDVPDLADHLAATLRTPARWIGLMGSLRHSAPHVEPLAAMGFADDEIARIHRPIGLDIGSKTPPEIAVATLAGLIADRTGRSGGAWRSPA
jgi:molybdenum cofactor synthesis domain-containing protein